MVEVHGDVYRTVDIGEQGLTDWKPGTVGRDYKSHPNAVEAWGVMTFAFLFGEFRKQSGVSAVGFFSLDPLFCFLCVLIPL